MKVLRFLSIAIVGVVLLVACKDDNSLGSNDDFNRKGMLTNWADNILIPAYSNFELQARDFDNRLKDFKKSSTSERLSELRLSFKDLYVAFQEVKAFEIGPAETVALRASLNTYPCDTSKIQANIQNNITDLSPVSQLRARGLPALDFILFGNGDDLLQDPKLMAYLELLSDDILSLAVQVSEGWTNYRSQFIEADGTDIGSSLGQVVNSMNKDYELIKNAKIGFPAGKRTLGKVYPKSCEGYYSQQSIVLATQNIKAIQSFFRGDYYNSSQNGLSLEDYLQAINAKSFDGDLDLAINVQFQKALSALEAINGTLSTAVVNEVDAVNTAYLEIQRNVLLLKTDMPSSMGVMITYQDNDGD